MGKQLMLKVSIMEDEALRNAILKVVTQQVENTLKTDAWSLVKNGAAIDILTKVSKAAEDKYTLKITDYVVGEVRKAVSNYPLNVMVGQQIREYVDEYLKNLTPERMEKIIAKAVKERLTGN